jgi:hypothetical protein
MKLRNWSGATQCREIGAHGMPVTSTCHPHSKQKRFMTRAFGTKVQSAIRLRQNPGMILQMRRRRNAA